MGIKYGYSPWMVWFAWYPVQLDTGGWVWLKYIRCRVFLDEPVWGASSDSHWQYELTNEATHKCPHCGRTD